MQFSQDLSAIDLENTVIFKYIRQEVPMQHFLLQIACLVVVLYVAISYNGEKKRQKIHIESKWFELLLTVSVFSIIFDGLSAYTVNNLHNVPAWLNTVAHIGYLIGLEALIFIMFLYMLHITDSFPRHWWSKLLLYGPFALVCILGVAFIGETEYRVGTISNYAMGVSVYICFITAGLYLLFSLYKFVQGWKYIEKKKRYSIGLFIGAVIVVTGIKAVYTELLITAIAPTLFVLGIYINQENPILKELGNYRSEMIMGFATLVESRDDSTGGHVRRTSQYVELLTWGLRNKGYYRELLTKDYIHNLIMAAPMHDIGKISVPDDILQKPDKLDDEEFEKMKKHAPSGSKIIQDTFGHLSDEQYKDIAYQVTRYHHEKWNGKGYPEGLKGEEIPLCARIMAIADVFDAISEKRCYRDALPLDECFKIIEEGRGTSFDPILVDVFLELRPQVEEIYKDIKHAE